MSFTTTILLQTFSPLPDPQLHLYYPKYSALTVVQTPTYRNHPVGQVTVLRHLHSSKHCQIDMASGNRKCVISISGSSNSPQILTSFCSHSHYINIKTVAYHRGSNHFVTHVVGVFFSPSRCIANANFSVCLLSLSNVITFVWFWLIACTVNQL